MDSQLRNFKDFLLLYNRITELCFNNCVDNFFSRNVADNESQCVDKCVTKFARFNQTMMGVYVEVQTEINNRRVQEIEEAAKKAATTPADTTPTTDNIPLVTEVPSTLAEALPQNIPNAP